MYPKVLLSGSQGEYKLLQSCLLDDIGYRAEVLIPFAQVRICKVKVCFLCDRYAGVAQYSA